MPDTIQKEFGDNCLEIRINPNPFTRQQTDDAVNQQFAYVESFFIGLKFSRPQ